MMSSEILLRIGLSKLWCWFWFAGRTFMMGLMSITSSWRRRDHVNKKKVRRKQARPPAGLRPGTPPPAQSPPCVSSAQQASAAPSVGDDEFDGLDRMRARQDAEKAAPTSAKGATQEEEASNIYHHILGPILYITDPLHVFYTRFA